MTRAELRAFAMAELESTLGAETEALKSLLLRPEPPESAMVQYRQLARLSHEMREKLLALQDAEGATQH